MLRSVLHALERRRVVWNDFGVENSLDGFQLQGACERAYELSSFIKDGEFLDHSATVAAAAAAAVFFFWSQSICESELRHCNTRSED